uniref:CASPASE_P20 domain-containing protein n=1 Tax=Rhabditophanes sp. KR3021 TaxID=114890 RepID=A0AC35TZB5_9BILA
MLERLISNPQSGQIIHSNIHKPFNFKCPNDVINKEDAAFDNIKMIPCQSANAYDLDYYKSDMNGIYPNFTSPRGLALIINNHRFKSMSDRTGTDVDKENLRILFRKLDYKTVEYTDLTGQEMLSTIKGFGRLEEHKTYHSTIVCVLTHGDNNALVGVDDNKVDVNEFIATLNNGNCPNLSQKPKLFFIQACRGGKI